MKMNNSDGTDSIPEVTPAAQELSKLNTLEEVRKNWVRYSGPAIGITPSVFGTGIAGFTPTSRKVSKRTALKKPKKTITKFVTKASIKEFISRRRNEILDYLI